MSDIVSISGEKLSSVGKVKNVKPFGSTVLIENLNPQEILGTDLYVGEETQTGSAPQAIVLALGPKLEENCGVKIGDRVIVQGSYVPVPNYKQSDRKLGIIELHNIKAILEE